MSLYRTDQEVLVYMPDIQRHVHGYVIAATPGAVGVSLDDRMLPVVVDPANHFAIQPYTTSAVAS